MEVRQQLQLRCSVLCSVQQNVSLPAVIVSRTPDFVAPLVHTLKNSRNHVGDIWTGNNPTAAASSSLAFYGRAQSALLHYRPLQAPLVFTIITTPWLTPLLLLRDSLVRAAFGYVIAPRLQTRLAGKPAGDWRRNDPVLVKCLEIIQLRQSSCHLRIYNSIVWHFQHYSLTPRAMVQIIIR